MSRSGQAVIHQRVRAHGGDATFRVAGVILASLMTSAIVYLIVSPEVAPLVAPLLANVNIAAFFVATLYFRDRQVPVFESGSLWLAATVIYASFPFLGFIAADMQWTPVMDNRLQQYPFVTAEIAWFAWQYTLYIAAFVSAYLLVRRRAVVPLGIFQPIRKSTTIAFLIVFAALLAVKWLIYLLYGIGTGTSHATADVIANLAQIRRLPVLVWQIVSRLFDLKFLAYMSLAILLIAQWRKRWWARTLLILWLAAEILFVYFRESARAPVVLLMLTVVLLYHRLVRPLSLKAVALGSTAFLAGFITLGILRTPNLADGALQLRSALTIANEFQVLFANAFDLHHRQRLGILGPVPWQIYAVDLYLEIPRQLLPFEKIDPALWYLDVLGIYDHSVGLAFGVMAQAALGFGWIDLVARGAVLGVFYAGLHRWYVKRAVRLWPTMFYVFVSIWSFYSFRATTFWSLHFIVYQFLPFFVVVKLLEIVAETRTQRGEDAVRPSAVAAP